MIYKGGCHCGAVRFEVEAPERLECSECNCSICTMSGYLHLPSCSSSPFDGQNWERDAHTLARLSKEP